MTDEVKSVLSDADKTLLQEYKQAQGRLLKSIQNTDQALTVLQRTVMATLGADQYWAKEAMRHIKLGMLTLYAAADTEPTIEILNELRKRKAKMEADAAALAAFKADAENAEEAQILEPAQENSPVPNEAEG